MRPPTDRQLAILRYLYEHGTTPPSGIAHGIGMNELPRIEGGGSGAGRGSGHRVFNPAQRIIGSLNGLAKRGLVVLTSRPDGLSGSAYCLTEAGTSTAKLSQQTPTERTS